MSVPSLDQPTSSPASEVVSPLGPKEGEQHLLAGEGVRGPNLDDWKESPALCLLYVVREYWTHKMR